MLKEDLAIITGSDNEFFTGIQSSFRLVDKSVRVLLLLKLLQNITTVLLVTIQSTEYADGGTPDSDGGAVEGGNYEGI